MRKTASFIAYSILFFSFATTFYFYPNFLGVVATHWGIDGEPNGFSDKSILLFFPFLTLVLYLLLVFMPKMDPMKENIKKFEDVYDDFILVFLLFMFYVTSLTLLWNLGLVFNMNTAIIPALSFLFYFIGIMLGSIKRNYMIGVRTPWTLANDEVWEKTNKMSGNIFKGIGIISLFSLIIPNYFFYVFIGSIIIGVIYIFIYSYLEYRKIEGIKKQKNKNK
jgi:uncharacterized membrane protein